jgi:PAS domain S-box-containing protein
MVDVATTKELLARIRSLEQQLEQARESLAQGNREHEADFQRRTHVFDVVLSTLPDLICTFDLDGCFTYANPALLGVWQKPLEEIIGKNTFDLGYPPDLAARIQGEVQTVIATKRQVKNLTPFTGGNGETRVYEYIFSPVLAGDDSLEQVTCTARDVTERHAAEDALRKSEERLTLALSAGGGVGTWDWDVASDRVYCDTRFARLFSLDPQEAASGAPISAFLDAVYPQDLPLLEERIQHATDTGGEFASEYRIVQPDGLVRWVYARGRCHCDASGHPVRFPGVVFVITDRKEAEEAVRASEAHLRAMAESIPQMAWAADESGSIFWFNQRWYDYTGTTLEEMQGWGWQKVHHPDTLPRVLAAWKQAIATGEPFEMVFPLKGADGQFRSFLTLIKPVKDSVGNVLRWFGSNTDITDQTKTQEQLRRVNRELEEFAYVASHDLQEPLRMVNIYTQLILKQVGAPNPDLVQFVGFVRQGIKRMETLINDLLTYSRAVHTDEIPVATADLQAALTEALSVLAVSIRDSGARISAPALPFVSGDASQLAHVFQNLLSNALKYRKTDMAPRIEISCTREGGRAVTAVADHGIGFEQRYAERIFGLFKRLHQDEIPGTGLGLAICQRIIERYGGKIWAVGRPGEGATFYFSLPCAQEPMA